MFAKLGLRFSSDTEALRRLEAFLNALADGTPAEVPDLAAGNAQFAGIEAALHRLAGGPEHSLAGLASQAEALSDMLTNSHEVVDQLLSSTRDTISFADTASAKGNEISTRSKGLASSIEQMGVGIKEVAEQTNTAAQVVTKAKTLTESAVEHVQLLGKSSLEIDEITKVIESVAEQTNLLALNATIEAARAGEMGKGFAVVAAEVKELARESASQVTSIQAKIKAIQSGTQTAIGYIQEIAAIIHNLEYISVAIASAVEEQAAVSREIGLHAQDTAEDSKVISSNMQEVVQYNQLAAEIIEALQGSNQELVSLARSISQAISQAH